MQGIIDPSDDDVGAAHATASPASAWRARARLRRSARRTRAAADAGSRYFGTRRERPQDGLPGGAFLCCSREREIKRDSTRLTRRTNRTNRASRDANGSPFFRRATRRTVVVVRSRRRTTTASVVACRRSSLRRRRRRRNIRVLEEQRQRGRFPTRIPSPDAPTSPTPTSPPSRAWTTYCAATRRGRGGSPRAGSGPTERPSRPTATRGARRCLSPARACGTARASGRSISGARASATERDERRVAGTRLRFSPATSIDRSNT